jgi:3-oxoacyl-[acyl-carrier protein] reductase
VTRLTVVSGGGTGIGYAIARAFAADGDDVWIIGRRIEVLRAAAAAEKINAEAGGHPVHWYAADLSMPEQVEATAAAVLRAGHPVDVLVNNAGGVTTFGAERDLAGVAAAWRRAVVAPGYVAETEFFGDRMTADGHAARVRQTLVGRAGVPDDIAAVVRFLASPEAG